MGEIKVVKLISGEDVIAKHTDCSPTEVLLESPLRLIMVPSEQGMGMALISLIPYSEDTGIVVEKSKIVYTVSPEASLREEYSHQTSTILTPSKGIIA